MAVQERTLGWVGVSAGLALAWLLAALSGVDAAISRHWFYVPVVLAAVYLGVRMTAVTAVVAGLLAGPLVPGAGFARGWDFHVGWGLRAFFLLAIGLLVATLVEYRRSAQAREVVLAQREQEVSRIERDTALQRDAVIQTVSHELRTPLTVIKGGLELLDARQEILPALQPLMVSMQRSCDRLTSLVSLVLAASDSTQVEDDAPTPIAVAELLRRAVGSVPTSLRPRVQVEDGVGDVRVLVKTPFVETVLRSLLDNALRFSPDGEPVAIRAESDTEVLRIEIRDHGPGIDPEVMQRVGTPFVQGDQSTTRPYGGLGLGLYTATKLVQRINGTLEVRPHTNGGTIAKVTIPAPLVTDP
jgi:signal transduction histidine kinase